MSALNSGPLFKILSRRYSDRCATSYELWGSVFLGQSVVVFGQSLQYAFVYKAKRDILARTDRGDLCTGVLFRFACKDLDVRR